MRAPTRSSRGFRLGGSAMSERRPCQAETTPCTTRTGRIQRRSREARWCDPPLMDVHVPCLARRGLLADRSSRLAAHEVDRKPDGELALPDVIDERFGRHAQGYERANLVPAGQRLPSYQRRASREARRTESERPADAWVQR